MNTVSERLDLFRKNKGLTYNDIAITLGLTEGAIRNAIKRDSIKLSHINVICDTYNVSKEWLLNGTGEMETSGQDIKKPPTKDEGGKLEEVSMLVRMLNNAHEEIRRLKERLGDDL